MLRAQTQTRAQTVERERRVLLLLRLNGAADAQDHLHTRITPDCLTRLASQTGAETSGLGGLTRREERDLPTPWPPRRARGFAVDARRAHAVHEDAVKALVLRQHRLPVNIPLHHAQFLKNALILIHHVTSNAHTTHIHF